MMGKPLKKSEVEAACRALSRKDSCLRYALSRIGSPVIRIRPDGYAGLFRIIIEQQVSVPSAQAILARCDAVFAPYIAEDLANADIEGLRSCGVSRPKAAYCLGLAKSICEGEVDLSSLKDMDDEMAASYLCCIKGIGPWSAAIYLLFCAGRQDIWPERDVALLASYRALMTQAGIKTAPFDPKSLDQKSFDKMADCFAPHRGVAAHILWTFYAHLKKRIPI